MKKTISTLIALTLVASFGMAQTPKPAAPAPAPAAAAQADPIVIAAGDLSIRQSEFESALKSLPAEYQQYAAGAGKKQFAEDYLRMKMLAAEGMKSGLDKDPDVLAQLALMRENLVAQAQLAKIEKGITVSDDDLKKKYEANKDQYEQVKARHILIAFKGSPAAQEGKAELTEEQAKAKAEDLRKQIAGGASFDELAKKESDDVGSGARGGDLGAFGRGQMVPEFEKAAFEAKAGDLTQVVRTQFGYHIIKVDEHSSTPFEQVKPTLEKNERQARMQAKLDEMKTAAKVTYNDTYFGVTPPPMEPPAQPAANPPASKQ
ncbi:MAG TPA: peptidylprolyl isomerase [Thermoanaerobaculia bacterium]